MALNLPAQGDSPPWGTKLNNAITALDSDLQTAKSDFDDRITTLEVAGPGEGGGGGSNEGAWFTGKLWYSLGTSITIENSYTAQLATLSGMILTNRGVSGASLSTASNGNIWNALTTQVAADAEVITIETINDFRLNVPLGAVTDSENPATSYYGALRAACNWILTNRPAARAFLLTAYGDAMNVGYPNGETANSHGKQYWEYNDAMRRIGQIYGIPVINVGEESGINFHTCQFFTTDMIHMNTLGGKRYAEYVWAKIKAIGWNTSRPTAPGAGAPVSVTGVSINQGSAIALAPGGTQQLSATIAPSNATNKSLVWSSNATGVATVSSDGNVTAVANGSATVTVTTQDGGFTDTITVTVQAVAATGVNVTPPSATLMPSQTQQLTADVLPTNAGNKNVTWNTSAPGVASVNSSGLVNAVANGSATITATTVDGGFTDTCALTVSDTVPVTGVTLVPPTVGVTVPNTTQLTATVLPANATNKAVTYQSSNPAIATVNSTGLVTAVAAGSATITVTTIDGSYTDTTSVTVTVVLPEWTLSPQTTFRGRNVSNLASSGSEITGGDPTAANYGAFLLNTPGDTACEFAVSDGSKGSWLVVGGHDGNASDFVGLGDANQGAMGYSGKFTAGSIAMTGAPTPATATTGWATDKVYRIGRVGTRVKIVRVDPGPTLVTIWDAEIATQFGNDPPYRNVIDLGVLCGASYSRVKNVKTGTWTPP